MFLKPDTRYYPESGVSHEDKQSIKGLKWLAYIGRNKNIIHAGNGREVHLAGVPNVKVGGYCKDTNEVFEYLGCFWHGCLCMPNRHSPIGNTNKTLQNRYEETRARLQEIKDAGYNVVSIWGCEFGKLLRETPGLENELYSHPYVN
jgi:hypothetical protein